jgi:hypothetical protein
MRDYFSNTSCVYQAAGMSDLLLRSIPRSRRQESGDLFTVGGANGLEK